MNHKNLLSADLSMDRPDILMVALYILLRVNHHIMFDEPMLLWNWVDASIEVDNLVNEFQVSRA